MPDPQGEGVRCDEHGTPRGSGVCFECKGAGVVKDKSWKEGRATMTCPECRDVVPDCQPIPEGERTFTEAEVSAAIRWFEGEIRSGDDVITPWAIFSHLGRPIPECLRCNGEGWIWFDPQRASGDGCPRCERTGLEPDTCPVCRPGDDPVRCPDPSHAKELLGVGVGAGEVSPVAPTDDAPVTGSDPSAEGENAASSRASSEPAPSGEGLEGVERWRPIIDSGDAGDMWADVQRCDDGDLVFYSDASAALEAAIKDKADERRERHRAEERAVAAEERAEEAEGRAQSFDSLYREFTSVEYREVQAQRDAAEAKLTRIEKLVERLEQAITNEMLDEIGFYAEVEIAAAEMADLLRGPHGEADTGPSRPASSEDDSGLAGGARVELGADE